MNSKEQEPKCLQCNHALNISGYLREGGSSKIYRPVFHFTNIICIRYGLASIFKLKEDSDE